MAKGNLGAVGLDGNGIQESLLGEHQTEGHFSTPHPRWRKTLASHGWFDLVREALEAYGQTMGMPGAFRVHDVSGRIAGVGSLGVRRFLALLEGQGPPDGYRLVDIKQAEPSALAGHTVAPQPDDGGDEARRVVHAQTVLQGRPSARPRRSAWKSSAGIEVVPENHSSLDRFRKQPAKLRAVRGREFYLTAWSHLRGGRLTLGPNQEQKQDHWPDLAGWSAGAAIDAVLAAAARYAERTNEESMPNSGRAFAIPAADCSGASRIDDETNETRID